MSPAADASDVAFRPAGADDIPLLLDFIRAMAAFEKLTVSATEDVLRESLFGEEPAARAVLIELDGEPIGYLIYYFTFSSMVGKRALYLEDLFVAPEFRGRGVGRAAMTWLAKLALERKCARFDWIVLDWNERAIAFYRGLGASILPDWRICRVEGAAIDRIASGDPAAGNP